MEKIYVQDKRYISMYDMFNGTPAEVIEKIKKQSADLEVEGWKNLKLTIFGDYEDVQIIYTGERLETDSEFNKRKGRLEAKLKKDYANLEKRKALFETLKQEFEGDGNKN
jgi:superoxide dismutase